MGSLNTERMQTSWIRPLHRLNLNQSYYSTGRSALNIASLARPKKVAKSLSDASDFPHFNLNSRK